MKALFSINQHDSDGDIYDSCILIHLDNPLIIRLKDLEDLNELIENLQRVSKEISEQ
jgi:hypothetical protein